MKVFATHLVRCFVRVATRFSHIGRGQASEDFYIQDAEPVRLHYLVPAKPREDALGDLLTVFFDYAALVAGGTLVHIKMGRSLLRLRPRCSWRPRDKNSCSFSPNETRVWCFELCQSAWAHAQDSDTLRPSLLGGRFQALPDD